MPCVCCLAAFSSLRLAHRPCPNSEESDAFCVAVLSAAVLRCGHVIDCVDREAVVGLGFPRAALKTGKTPGVFDGWLFFLVCVSVFDRELCLWSRNDPVPIPLTGAATTTCKKCSFCMHCCDLLPQASSTASTMCHRQHGCRPPHCCLDRRCWQFGRRRRRLADSGSRCTAATSTAPLVQLCLRTVTSTCAGRRCLPTARQRRWSLATVGW